MSEERLPRPGTPEWHAWRNSMLDEKIRAAAQRLPKPPKVRKGDQINRRTGKRWVPGEPKTERVRVLKVVTRKSGASVATVQDSKGNTTMVVVP